MTLFDHGPAWLFVPGDRPERWAKAAARADVVIIDLEDAVAPASKGAARALLAECALDRERLVVRVNAAGTPEHAADVAVVRELGCAGVIVPKASDRASLGAAAGTGALLIGLCETAAGVLGAAGLASYVDGLMFGSEDLAASVGGPFSRGGDGTLLPHLQHARTTVALAAAAGGKPWIDTPLVRLDAVDLLTAESRSAMEMGAAAKACIHPDQVHPVRAGFRPTDDELAWARSVLDRAPDGVSALDGVMVDPPVLAQARRLVALASR